jgi:hypothetical protein
LLCNEISDLLRVLRYRRGSVLIVTGAVKFSCYPGL